MNNTDWMAKVKSRESLRIGVGKGHDPKEIYSDMVSMAVRIKSLEDENKSLLSRIESVSAVEMCKAATMMLEFENIIYRNRTSFETMKASQLKSK